MNAANAIRKHLPDINIYVRVCSHDLRQAHVRFLTRSYQRFERACSLDGGPMKINLVFIIGNFE